MRCTSGACGDRGASRTDTQGVDVRFEVISAFVVGGLIPVLATCLDYGRSGFTYSAANFVGNLEDYLAGALLLFAGQVSLRVRSFAPVFLVLAWAYCTSMMFGSFWGQIEGTLRGETEAYNTFVILFKLAFLGTSAVSLVLSFRRAVRGSGA